MVLIGLKISWEEEAQASYAEEASEVDKRQLPHRFTLNGDCPGGEWQGGTLGVTACLASDQEGPREASAGCSGRGEGVTATFSLDSKVSLALIEAKMASLSKPQVSPMTSPLPDPPQ